MNNSTELIQHCRRRWWWSKEPYWKYLDAQSRGWANLVDVHPGMFNIVWLMSDSVGVPTDFTPYAPTVQWVMCKTTFTKVNGAALADLALQHTLKDFTQILREYRVKLPVVVPRDA